METAAKGWQQATIDTDILDPGCKKYHGAFEGGGPMSLAR